MESFQIFIYSVRLPLMKSKYGMPVGKQQ